MEELKIKDDLPKDYYQKRYEEIVKDTIKITKAYEETKEKLLLAIKERDYYFETTQMQSEYIKKIEEEIAGLKKKIVIDPDALLTIK